MHVKVKVGVSQIFLIFLDIFWRGSVQHLKLQRFV